MKEPKFTLEKILKKKGWSQYKLAKELGLTTAQVFVLCKSGANPTMKTMVDLARALNVSLDDLVER